MLKIKYTDEVESTMRKFFESLSEKDRRRYAAIEALKLGYGGQSYICEILYCDPDTVKKGLNELQNDEIKTDNAVRRPGGGKKKRLT